MALFAFGPWKYPISDGRLLYGFLLTAHLAFAVGYLSARWKVPKVAFSADAISLLINASLAVTIALLIPTSLLDTGSPLPNVLFGITHPGEAYAQSLHLRSERAFVYVSYVRVLLGPLLFLLFPLLVTYWQNLSNRVRVLGVTAVGFGAAISIAEGVNKNLADLIGLIPVLLVVAYFSGRLHLSLARWGAVAAAWLLAAGVFAAYFGATQATRAGSASEYGSLPVAIASPTPGSLPSPSPSGSPSAMPVASPSPTGSASPTPTPVTYPGGVRSISVDYGHPMIRFAPGRFRTLVVGATSYLTQGYYALYLSLRKPFVPMFGVGNSLFLTQQAVRLTGNPDIARMSYPSRIQEDGWDAIGRWSSIYPWIASDVSFPGTILVVFLIGRFFAIAWFDALSSRNPFALAMVAQFAIMLFYFPANNQTSQFGEGFTAFWGILVAWLLTRNGRVQALYRGLSPQKKDPAGNGDDVRSNA